MPRQYDLDLLRYLHVLVEEQSVSAAARRMKVSEPTMSRQLGKLREAFGDPILVQSGRRMVPTAFATRIREKVGQLVLDAERLHEDREKLDLTTVSPRFTIRASDVIVGAFASELVQVLRRDCPQCDVCFTPETDEHVGDAMRRQTIDLYIGATDEMRPELRRQSLFAMSIRGMVRRGHPILAEGVTPQNLVRYDHIGVSRKGLRRGPIDTILQERYGLRRRVVLVVPSHFAMIESIRETDMILPMPDIVIDRLPTKLIRLVAFDFPFALQPVEAFQAWHPRHDFDPVHRWLRDTVFRITRRRAAQPAA
ncbi:transcriptional regulator, LysR family [Gluconacetobacter diazotrophicus PA1 5]|uniref:LysR family transcriptional regulator n=2 Tax=Gluconacetobacter diazotrophicus TaxID=33996 RepID=A0A7W4I3G1_GLUDI|nr:LysR family transcriptional regulator [Gluconacetobacter diazotrophicus]ACI50255.1 transcriptional regulator, LysR family [Gluconacetobacter diazotrophicus PA1 5]MBB2154832.1 LysR family transcriptional regulator [Gluconacetobacter diazotrophicus]TWB07989.1 LysR family transcriptional regulator [Gluconacetobacter diazotrophicus]CAP56184.1 putative transcriptional Regulator, LysR family [Gluconacetobacter diazotrophicus PA1 5]